MIESPVFSGHSSDADWIRQWTLSACCFVCSYAKSTGIRTRSRSNTIPIQGRALNGRTLSRSSPPAAMKGAIKTLLRP
jgi:hypothetical protein